MSPGVTDRGSGGLVCWTPRALDLQCRRTLFTLHALFCNVLQTKPMACDSDFLLPIFYFKLVFPFCQNRICQVSTPQATAPGAGIRPSTRSQGSLTSTTLYTKHFGSYRLEKPKKFKNTKSPFPSGTKWTLTPRKKFYRSRPRGRHRFGN